MDIGQIKWFNQNQGFGFIQHTDGREVYFHYTSIARGSDQLPLEDGATVEFNILTTEQGLEASNVRVHEG